MSTKKKIITSFSAVEQVRLNEMANYRGHSIQDVIRRSIDTEYREYSREVYGYKGVVSTKRKINKEEKTDARDAKISALEAMDDPTLSAYLIEIGYSSPDEVLPDGTSVKYEVKTTEHGRYYYETRENEPTNFHYSSTLLTWDELIADLKKEKKI